MRSPRPAPRTLASPPVSAPLRAPRASGYEARFPALSVVLASGVVLPACHDTVCGTSRADELEHHGREGLREAGSGHVAKAFRELGVALGALDHARTTVPDVQVAGAAPMVRPTPPVPQVQTPQMVGGGATVPVNPMPVVPTPPAGEPNSTHATPHGRTRRTPAPLHNERPVQGDQARVGPLPIAATTARG